jgi:hypothetical protein
VLCHPRTLHQITCGWVRCCPPANFVWHAHFWDEFRSPHRPIHTRLAASIWARRHRIHARRAAAREGDVIRQILACALFAAAWVVPASAQTMSYADAISQLAAACRNDIARYCKGVPLGPSLKTCFDTNGARMSPQCQQSRTVVYASISRRAAAQRNIGDVCSADIARLCGTSHADAHLVECLLSVSPAALSSQCGQTFDDTGWRTERARQ